jgi:LPS sulfotransferase NodH
MELSFESLTSGLQVDHADLELTLSSIIPADRKYVILFTPRSGSTWLTAVIVATGCLGRPEEYLNPEFVPGVAKGANCTARRSLLPALLRKCKTDNGVFGIEVLASHIEIFGESDFFEGIGTDALYYYLWRANIVAQGISLYKAVTTGKFHSTDEREELTVVAYDAAGIKYWTEHILQIEIDNFNLLCKRGLPCRFLCYENIVWDEATTLESFSGPLLGRSLLESEISKEARRPSRMADEWNLAAETRFRLEMAEFVQGLNSRRVMKNARS